MKTRRAWIVAHCAAVLVAVAAVSDLAHADGPAIAGTWFVKDSAAPFPYQMYVFHADGTMSQSNPDAGDSKASDSEGQGVWVSEGGKFKGKWIEITADRATHKYTGRGE